MFQFRWYKNQIDVAEAQPPASRAAKLMIANRLWKKSISSTSHKFGSQGAGWKPACVFQSTNIFAYQKFIMDKFHTLQHQKSTPENREKWERNSQTDRRLPVATTKAQNMPGKCETWHAHIIIQHIKHTHTHIIESGLLLDIYRRVECLVTEKERDNFARDQTDVCFCIHFMA